MLLARSGFQRLLQQICKEVDEGNAAVLSELRRVIGDSNYKPCSAQGLCNEILTTCYMGSENSSGDYEM